jgi:hypothetical protein
MGFELGLSELGELSARLREVDADDGAGRGGGGADWAGKHFGHQKSRSRLRSWWQGKFWFWGCRRRRGGSGKRTREGEERLRISELTTTM